MGLKNFLRYFCCCTSGREEEEEEENDSSSGLAAMKESKLPDRSLANSSSFFGRISARASLISMRDYKMCIQLLDDSESIVQEFKKTANAQIILDYVCDYLNIVEKDYFGLRYQDAYKNRYWMDLNKPISKQIRSPNVVLHFRVRFYPSDISLLKEEITRYQLFAQLQRDLLHGRLYCPQDQAAKLAALILQSVIGDYDADERPTDYVSQYKLLLRQTEKIEEKIAEVHKTLKSLTPAEAELEFLKSANNLETYGFDPYSVNDKQGHTLYLGATHRGIFIYHLTRVIHRLKWQDVVNLDYLGRELFIVPALGSLSSNASADRLNGIGEGFVSTPDNGSTKDSTGKAETLKYVCSSATYAKHLWRHILSQKAFFTENDAKHIKPKFSKPRIPLLSRGSTFRFPATRVSHEIEMETSKPVREGPEPQVIRYHLQRQPPRAHIATTNNYNTLPLVRPAHLLNETIPEDGEESKIEENNVENVVEKEENVRIEVEPLATSSAYVASTSDDTVAAKVHPVETIPESESSSKAQQESKQTGEKVDWIAPEPCSVCDAKVASENIETKIEEKPDQQIQSSPRSCAKRTAKIFFSSILFVLLLTAIVVAFFENEPDWLESLAVLEIARHSYYEPARNYFISLYNNLNN